jgi:signal transduction histidine kinase
VVLCVGVLAFANLATVVPFFSLCPAAERDLAETDWLGISLVLIGAVSLAWRRRAPMAVLAITAAAFCGSLLLGYPPAQPLAPMIALFALAVVHSSLVTAAAGAVAGLVIVTATATYLHWRADFDDRVLEDLLLLAAACLLGYGVQLSRARRSVLIAQEARLAREHAALTQQAVRDEKSRIARELHDIIAHSVSVITAQATGAQQVFDTEPGLARDALRSIETTGRGALTEMRRLLGVLQLENDDPGIEPQPGLDQLPLLIAQMERSGFPVELIVTGDPRPLSSGVQLNAFRIVQEALTNTLKHAGPARARVELGYRSDRLNIRICDSGRGFGADAVLGNGLIGMRQRAAMLGGELAVGPGPGGGVLVSVSLSTET